MRVFDAKAAMCCEAEELLSTWPVKCCASSSQAVTQVVMWYQVGVGMPGCCLVEKHALLAHNRALQCPMHIVCAGVLLHCVI